MPLKTLFASDNGQHDLIEQHKQTNKQQTTNKSNGTDIKLSASQRTASAEGNTHIIPIAGGRHRLSPSRNRIRQVIQLWRRILPNRPPVSLTIFRRLHRRRRLFRLEFLRSRSCRRSGSRRALGRPFRRRLRLGLRPRERAARGSRRRGAPWLRRVARCASTLR